MRNGQGREKREKPREGQHPPEPRAPIKDAYERSLERYAALYERLAR